MVNYNGFNDTVECVESLKKISYSNYEIIVVDNHSTEAPTAWQLEYLQLHTRYIANNINLGFSGGNNVGIQMAKELGAQYVLLINNDTTVKEDFLDVLVEASIKNPNCGIVGGKIKFHKHPDLIWFGGGEFDKKTGEGKHQRWNCVDNENIDEIKKVTFLTGCLMLIPMSVISTVGMLEEKYFLYSEDTEYCCRVMASQYQLLYCDNAVIFHKVSASTGEKSDISQYYMIRNKLYIVKEYCEKTYLCYARIFWKLAKDIVRGRMDLMPNLRGVYDFMRGKTGQWKR